MAKVWWVVVAAGQSTRMGAAGAKMWAEVQGRPVMAWTIEAISHSGALDQGVVVVRAEDLTRTTRLVAAQASASLWQVVAGGEARADSVRLGLEAVVHQGGQPSDMVLIHDGARPMLSAPLIARVVQAVQHQGAAIPLVPVADTVKLVDTENQQLVRTVERATLGLAQTPQGFRLGAILEAHRALGSGIMVTDDAEVMERSHQAVAYVEGDPGNRKITTPDDLVWLRWWVSLTASLIGKEGASDANWSGI